MFYNKAFSTSNWKEVVVPMYNGLPVRELYSSNGDLLYDGLNIENDAVRYFLDALIILDSAYYKNTNSSYDVTTYPYTYEGALALHNAGISVISGSDYSKDFKNSVFMAMYRNNTTYGGNNYDLWNKTYNNNISSNECPWWTIRPFPIVLNAEGGTKVRVSQNQDFSDYYDFSVGTSINVENPEDASNDMVYNIGSLCTCLYNLIPGIKYYFRVLDAQDNIIKEGSLTPRGRLRMINLDNVNNVRDLGGWKCDGGHLAYGKLYRGCSLAKSSDLVIYASTYPSTKARQILVNLLKVTNAIDLRSTSDYSNYKPSITGITFVSRAMSDLSIYGESGLIASKTSIKNVLTDIGNLLDLSKVIYFYCNHGLDRTGTIACLIELICGCDFLAVMKDWELSTFHTNDLLNAPSLYNEKKLWASILFLQTQTGDTLKDKCINWLKSIGVTDDTINKIRSNMIVTEL